MITNFKIFEYFKEWIDDNIIKYPIGNRRKIKLIIEIYELVKLLGGEINIDKEIRTNVSNIVNRLLIIPNSGAYFWQELYVEEITNKTKERYNRDALTLSFNLLMKIYEYLKENFPDIYQEYLININANKYNL